MNVNDIKLFSHNQDTYDKIQETWKTSNKVASVQATGTGKSYLILKCLYNEADKNKIVLAPSNYILEQFESEAGEILPNTILMTYTKLSFMSDEEIRSLNLSLIIMDEFHRCGAESWGTGVQKLLDKYPNAKILGTSATNIRFLDNNRDMADELFNGNVVTNLSLAEAIVKKILPMPKYVSALYTFENEIENLKNKVGNSKNTKEEKEELLKEIDRMKNKLNRSKGIPQIIKKHLNTTNDKFIVFCKDSNHLSDMKKVVTEWFKKAKIFKSIKTYTAYSGYNNTDKEVGDFIKNKNDNEIKLLFTIDMFNEGIHIKDVSGVVLLRPTISPIIYYQQIGRAIQVGKENKSIIFDFVNNFDNIGAKNFICDLTKSSKQREDSNNNENDNNRIDDFEFMIFDEIQEAKNLFEQIEEKLYDSWENNYDKLKEYRERTGNCNVSPYDENNKNLGFWVYNQRQRYNKGEISTERINKLNMIGFSWDVFEEKWNDMYNKLEQFYLENKSNNSCILSNISDSSIKKWVRTQRELYKKGKLDREKIIKLEKINFIWDEFDEKWNEIFKKLKSFYKKDGNINIAKNDIENIDLYNWIVAQRLFCKKGKLSKEKIEKLNSINFDWNPEASSWNEMFKRLKSYKKKYGEFKVYGGNIKEGEKELTHWVTRQRKKYKNNTLSLDRIKMLESIEFDFKIK